MKRGNLLRKERTLDFSGTMLIMSKEMKSGQKGNCGRGGLIDVRGREKDA